MSLYDIAWAAGFIDGEGCIHIHKMTRKNNIYFGLILHVSNTNYDSILKLKTIFNCGSIQVRKTCSDKNIWTYVVTGKEAASVLSLIKDYSIVKLSEINLALEFQSTIIHGGKVPSTYDSDRLAYYEKMKELK
jgi:hypothetical protein